jgi:hypothetical protein
MNNFEEYLVEMQRAYVAIKDKDLGLYVARRYESDIEGESLLVGLPLADKVLNEDGSVDLTGEDISKLRNTMHPNYFKGIEDDKTRVYPFNEPYSRENVQLKDLQAVLEGKCSVVWFDRVDST